MSHSRIYQISTSPIDKKEFIKAETFIDDSSLWYWLATNYCIDYLENETEKQRKDSIIWLKTVLEEDLNCFDFDGKNKFTLKPGFEDTITNFWYHKVRKAFMKLSDKHIGDITERYNLKWGVLDPLSNGYGFLFYLDGEPIRSDIFFEKLLSMKEGDSFYVGGTIDYHY